MKKPPVKAGKKPMGKLPGMPPVKAPAPSGKSKMPPMPMAPVNPNKVPFQAPKV